MKIETSTQKTIWVHLDPDELQKMLIDAACRAARLRAGLLAANVHFTPDAAGTQPARRAMRASVELLVTSPRKARPPLAQRAAGAA